MARTIADLPPDSRITDYISLGAIAKYFPPRKVNFILSETGRTSIRQRDLPAPVVVYYIIALALYMQSSCREVLRCLLEGIQWLRDPASAVKVAGKSGISQARSWLGWEPLKRLFEAVVALPSRQEKPRAHGTAGGGWQRLTAARWMLLTPWTMKLLSIVRLQLVDPVPIPSSGSPRLWKAELGCCLRPDPGDAGTAKSMANLVRNTQPDLRQHVRLETKTGPNCGPRHRVRSPGNTS